MPGISDELEARQLPRDYSAPKSTRPSRLKIAARYVYPGRFVSPTYASYVFLKLLFDPVYRVAESELRGSDLPLLDIGCGIGLLACHLRSCGHRVPIRGIDYDARKIEMARRVMRGEPAATFAVCDARIALPDHSGNVAVLDILQYMPPGEQQAVLAAAASRVAPGGRLIMRSGLRADNWRFRLTHLADRLSRLATWMAEPPVAYPSRETFTVPLEAAGLSGRIEPLSGHLPFHNFLIVFHRATVG
jgi:SAM-dependent methyltransferase